MEKAISNSQSLPPLSHSPFSNACAGSGAVSIFRIHDGFAQAEEEWDCRDKAEVNGTSKLHWS